MTSLRTLVSVFAIITTVLITLRWATELWLDRLNERHVRFHANELPEGLKQFLDPATYAKSVQYTLARSQLGRWEDTYHATFLLIVLFCGVLPWLFDRFSAWLGASVWSMAAYLFSVGVVFSIASLPFDWHRQFHLEQRFGFNTTTPGTWWADRLKGLLLAATLGGPLLALILKLVEWTGDAWWLWAWAALVAFELLMVVLAPVLILPLFNKLTPLPEGPLRTRLLNLGQRIGFHARNILVMDGSKRSRHSNAFFTGFGQFRKIVLFDTLIQQLAENELEAVLAHEIGHYQRRHVPKFMVWSAASSLLGFYALSLLAGQEWFYRAFGFAPGPIAPALLIFALLSGTVTFWFTPLVNRWSRKYEYEADAYAASTMKEAGSLVGALRKLEEKNLGNLTPHPLYSGFHYSHPTLLEREQALAQRPGCRAAGR